MKLEVQLETCKRARALVSELMIADPIINPTAEELVAIAKLDQKISQLESS